MKLQISVDNKLYDVDVEIPEDSDLRSLAGYIPPYAPTERVTIPPVPPVSSSPGAAATSGSTENDRVCRCPMAGVVVRVVAQVGQQLQQNDLLMVLEAMKMETNITAPISGKVKAINAQAGGAVAVDQVLVEFE